MGAQPATDIWSEIWDVLGPLLEGVVNTSEAFWAKDHPVLGGAPRLH